AIVAERARLVARTPPARPATRGRATRPDPRHPLHRRTHMATTRTSKTHWEGSLMEGAGTVALESSGVGTFDVSWPSRAEEANGKTSPEELIAAAHSACYSMALSHALAGAGTPPQSVDTSAAVTFQ